MTNVQSKDLSPVTTTDAVNTSKPMPETTTWQGREIQVIKSPMFWMSAALILVGAAAQRGMFASVTNVPDVMPDGTYGFSVSPTIQYCYNSTLTQQLKPAETSFFSFIQWDKDLAEIQLPYSSTSNLNFIMQKPIKFE